METAHSASIGEVTQGVPASSINQNTIKHKMDYRALCLELAMFAKSANLKPFPESHFIDAKI